MYWLACRRSLGLSSRSESYALSNSIVVQSFVASWNKNKHPPSAAAVVGNFATNSILHPLPS